MQILSGPGSTVILNVDDNEAGLYAKTRALRRAGHEVIEARTAHEALELLRSRRPGLVILDVHLPDMDGRDVCAHIKAQDEFAGTLVLQTSATFIETHDRVRGLEQGADMYLVEPVEPSELLAVVAAMLRLLEAERGLRASARRYRMLTRIAPVGIFHADPTGRWLYANQTWCQMAGWRYGEAIPGDWLNAVYREDRDRVRSLWRSAVNEGSYFSAEFRLQEPGGGTAWVWTQAQPERDDSGAVAGYVGSATDITERKESEVMLREADRHKDEFLAMLAHELRNPLQPISNAAQLIGMRKGDDGVIGQAHDIINRQLSQLKRLVDDLLDVSRITRGLVRLQKGPVRLVDVIDSAVESVRTLANSRGHVLQVSAPPAAVTLQADFTRLVQLLVNLLDNAAKYTPEGGRISLQAVREGHEAVIRVADNGRGIAPELLPRVFDLFTQGSSGLDRADGGLGIGLTLVKRLTELHGGHVEARSEGVGAGAEFTVRLPLHEAAAPAQPEAANRPVAPQQAAQRILVVDDNQDAAESLCQLLELSGHKATTAHDGPKTLRLARSFRPTLVLLDIGLPGMDGYEVARRLLEEPQHAGLRVVAMTGYGQDSDRERSRAAGFFGHLVKPVSLDDLNALLVKAGSE